MPRNGSGTASVVNSFTPSTLISASQMNANFVDMASMMTASLPRDGQAAMTGQMKGASGTVSLPGITFSADPSCGAYRIGASNIGFAIAAAQVMEWDANGINLPAGKTVRQAGQALVPVGVIQDYVAASAPTGWVRANGRTIGNGSSGGTERANADTSDLFTLLWTEHTNAILAIEDSAGTPSTRGASAAADFAANKRMPLPDLRGRVLAGRDSMGQSAAGRLGVVIASADLMGAFGGIEAQTLLEANLPAHTHSDGTLASASDGAHQHFTVRGEGGNQGISDTNYLASSFDDGGNTSYLLRAHGTAANVCLTSSGGTHTHDITGATGSTGSGTAHSNLQPTWLVTKIIKL